MPPRQDTLLGLVLGVRPLFFSSGFKLFHQGRLFYGKGKFVIYDASEFMVPLTAAWPHLWNGTSLLHRTWLLYGRMLTTNSGFSPHAKDPLSMERFHGKVSHLYKHPRYTIMCFPRSLYAGLALRPGLDPFAKFGFMMEKVFLAL